VISSKGSKPLPIDLAVTFADETTTKIHRAVDVWQKGNTTVTVVIPSTKKISKIVLGGPHIPDVNKADNTYTVK